MKDVNALLAISAVLYLFVARAGWVLQNASITPVPAAIVANATPDRADAGAGVAQDVF